jgi:hypothetical protein
VQQGSQQSSSAAATKKEVEVAKCPICLDEETQEKPLMVIPCVHAHAERMHPACLIRVSWVIKQCPLCREPFLLFFSEQRK